MLTTMRAVLVRDLLLAMRRKTDAVNTVAFFVVVVALFPLGVGPEPNQLQAIAGGVVWVAALLATLLSLGRLFAADYADGTLEQIALSPQPLALIVFGKVIAYWLTSGFLLVVIGPALGLALGLSVLEAAVLGVSLLLGTPVLAFIGAIGAALTLGVRGGGVLLALLVLPLYVPVLIFGAGAATAASGVVGAAAQLWLLAALLVFAMFFAPWACATALRIALE